MGNLIREGVGKVGEVEDTMGHRFTARNHLAKIGALRRVSSPPFQLAETIRFFVEFIKDLMYISTYAVLIEKFCTQQYNKEKTLRERKTEHVAINLDKELVSCNVSSMPPDAYAV